MDLSQFQLSVPNIAQLVERSTVDFADIEWSLVRFRVFGQILYNFVFEKLKDEKY